MQLPTDPRDVALFADELPVGIWVGRVPGGEVLYVNRAFRQILGMEPPTGAARGNYVAPYGVFTREGQPYPEHAMPYERAVAAGAPIEVDDLVIHRGDDTRVYLRVFARPLFDSTGAITHVVEAFTDITREVDAERARAESEARLLQAQRMESIGNLASGVAHDFNNLLAAAKLLLAQLARDAAGASSSQALDDLERIVDSGARLTRALLDFARRRRHPSQRVALNDIVRTTAELSRRTIDPRIAIGYELAPDLDAVRGDPTQFEQLVLNLVLNARDAMPEGGAIALRTRNVAGAPEPGDAGQRPGASRHVVLEVSDTGPGIPAAIRERIFEPYFTTKNSGALKGTGLGLATVYGVVQSHNGVIEVLDAEPHGATIRVTLPSASEPESKPGDSARAGAPGSACKGRVLLVEDDPALRAAASQALADAGYRAVVAADGNEALEIYRARAGHIDAALVDVVMPTLSGPETCRALRKLDPALPLLLTTGSAMTPEAEALLADRTCGFLPKPYGPDELIAAIDRARAQRA